MPHEACLPAVTHDQLFVRHVIWLCGSSSNVLYVSMAVNYPGGDSPIKMTGVLVVPFRG